MINLSISGSHGRMGQSLIRLSLADSEFKIKTLLEHPDHPKVKENINNIAVSTNPEDLKGSDVLIEFTSPQATIDNLAICVKHNIKMIIGTTGLTPEQVAKIKDASSKIPIVFSSNMSVGVNILFGLARAAAKQTGQNYSAKITEAHHIHKKDKPSGTAKTLAEFVEQGSGIKVTDIESIREGEIVGDHDVIFEGPEDILTIRHHAKNRDIFTKGALVAAKFLANKNNGLFHMQDVLGLS